MTQHLTNWTTVAFGQVILDLGPNTNGLKGLFADLIKPVNVEQNHRIPD